MARDGAWQPLLALPERIAGVYACHAPLGKRLVAVVSEHSVGVYATHTAGTQLRFAHLVSFFLGGTATALAWSPGAAYEETLRIEYVP